MIYYIIAISHHGKSNVSYHSNSLTGWFYVLEN